MKLPLSLCVALLICSYTMAQRSDVPAAKVKAPDVEEDAQYPGGDSALYSFVKRNIIYPKIAMDSMIAGTEIVRFIVNKDGSLSDIQIRKSLGAQIDSETLRIISYFPKFKAAMVNGKPARSIFTLPINFELFVPQAEGYEVRGVKKGQKN